MIVSRAVVAARLRLPFMVQAARLGHGGPDKRLPYRQRGLTNMDIQEIDADEIGEDTWHYRRPSEFHCNYDRNITIFASTVFWSYVLIRLFYDWPLIFGEWTMPDPVGFSDKELGIPPDDEE